VELQELVLRAATIQMRFPLEPMFADVRGALIRELRTRFSLQDYGWAEAVLQASNEARTQTFIIGSRELRVSYEHLERVEEFIEASRSFFEFGVETLQLEAIEFLGVRTYWFAAVDSFEELRDWLAGQLAAGSPFGPALNQRLSDIGWSFEFRDQSPEHLLRVGPMRVEQLLDQIFATDDRDLFPEQFLYVDLDRIVRAPPAIEASEAAARAVNSVDAAMRIGERIAASVATAVDQSPVGS
jgi:hypothetical protein